MKIAKRPSPGYGLPDLSGERKEVLAGFQKAAMIRFKSPELLNLSFVHRSFSHEANYKYNNERLEFLGDAVLGAVTSALLYDELAEMPEGELAKVKAVVVSEDTLAGVARELRLDTLLLLGRGEELTGGREKDAILADALEALIGALYLDSGYKAAFGFVSRFVDPEITRVLRNQHRRNYKSLLQELSQERYRVNPDYRFLRETGPAHDRFFWMEVRVNGQTFGPGTGKNKKDAQQEAAKIAYEDLTGNGPLTGSGG
jgi:ribonuclease-3